MFHSLINFCLFVFICYAVAGSARAILFSRKKRAKRPARRRTAPAAKTNTVRRPAPAVVRRKAQQPRANKQAEILYLNQAA